MFSGDGHTKAILNEAKDEVLLGQTGLVGPVLTVRFEAFQNM